MLDHPLLSSFPSHSPSDPVPDLPLLCLLRLPGSLPPRVEHRYLDASRRWDALTADCRGSESGAAGLTPFDALLEEGGGAGGGVGLLLRWADPAAATAPAGIAGGCGRDYGGQGLLHHQPVFLLVRSGPISVFVCWVTLSGLRLTSIFSTPDYITPETPQVANEFDEDEVERLRFFSPFWVWVFVIPVIVWWVEFSSISPKCLPDFVFVQENTPCPKSPKKSANHRSKVYRTVCETSTHRTDYQLIGMLKPFLPQYPMI